jgi:hypothetical protein
VWSSDVFSFDRFKIWTAQQNLKVGHGEYIQATRVDDTVIAVALANMHVGNGDYHVTPQVDNVFWLMNEQRALLSVDVLSMLKQDLKSNTQTLDAHIRHLQLVTQKTETHVGVLQERAQNLFNESNACLVTKREGDQQFFAWVDAWNDNETQAWLARSLEYAPCYITKRIEANAASYLASYLIALQPLLVHRHNILSVNRDKLLTYNGLFEGTILDELQTIKQQVTIINSAPVAPADVDSVFSFWKFDQNTKLPTYNMQNFWFPDGKIPTYENPGINLRTSF